MTTKDRRLMAAYANEPLEFYDGEKPYVPVRRKPERLYTRTCEGAKALASSKPKRKTSPNARLHESG